MKSESAFTPESHVESKFHSDSAVSYTLNPSCQPLGQTPARKNKAPLFGKCWPEKIFSVIIGPTKNQEVKFAGMGKPRLSSMGPVSSLY